MSAAATKLTERGKGRLIMLDRLREGYTTSFDDTKISYRSFGKGGPPVVCCNGLGVSTFFWAYLEKYFRFSRQVVTWDYRGHGKSELIKNKEHYNLAALVEDCLAVLDELKIRKAIFAGHSLGTQILFELYRRAPERIAGLVLCFGTYGNVMDTFYNMRFSRTLFEICYFLGTTFPKQSSIISTLLLDNPLSYRLGGLLKIMDTGMMSKEDSARYIKHILSVDPLFFTMLLKSAQDHNAEELLNKIKIPTLIISGEYDQFTPVWISKKMHRLIPRSELFVLKKATHAGLVEQHDAVNLRIDKFIRERFVKTH